LATFLFLLLLIPFIIAILGVGGIVFAAVLGILAMPFVWLYSAFRTNKS